MSGIETMMERGGEWLRGAGPQGDTVISSRVRLARNLAGYPFVHRCKRAQRREVLARCQSHVMALELGREVLWIDLSACEELDRQVLVERQLISRQHACAGAEAPRSVVLDTDETFAIMVNEEDHLRMSVLRSGLQLEEAFEQVDAIDDHLEARLDWAYGSRLGYLTACPTNVGTGIRVSVMLHLPALALTGEMEKVKRAARDMNLAVRGLFGEGSEALGDLYQISNQCTLGRSEQELLDDFQKRIVPEVIAYEQQARQALVRYRPARLDDRIWRAWGLLTHARILSVQELLAALSDLRLGVNLGRVDTVDIRTINELFLLAQPAHLQKRTGCRMEQATRRQARARFVRRHLGAR